MAVDIPQFALPFRIVNGAAAVVEQDGDTEVLQCAATVLAYRPGQREDLPDFGTRDQAHRQGGANLVELADAVERWEDRVHAVASRLGTDSLGVVDRVRMNVERGTDG